MLSKFYIFNSWTHTGTRSFIIFIATWFPLQTNFNPPHSILFTYDSYADIFIRFHRLNDYNIYLNFLYVGLGAEIIQNFYESKSPFPCICHRGYADWIPDYFYTKKKKCPEMCSKCEADTRKWRDVPLLLSGKFCIMSGLDASYMVWFSRCVLSTKMKIIISINIIICIH